MEKLQLAQQYVNECAESMIEADIAHDDIAVIRPQPQVSHGL